MGQGAGSEGARALSISKTNIVDFDGASEDYHFTIMGKDDCKKAMDLFQKMIGWGLSDWVELAGEDELIYAYYDEDMNAEFIHVRDGVCLRAYTQYDDEVDTDEGEDAETSAREWSDVGDYMDKHMV